MDDIGVWQGLVEGRKTYSWLSQYMGLGLEVVEGEVEHLPCLPYQGMEEKETPDLFLFL